MPPSASAPQLCTVPFRASVQYKVAEQKQIVQFVAASNDFIGHRTAQIEKLGNVYRSRRRISAGSVKVAKLLEHDCPGFDDDFRGVRFQGSPQSAVSARGTSLFSHVSQSININLRSSVYRFDSLIQKVFLSASESSLHD